MVKPIKNCLSCGIFLLLCLSSFLFSKEVEVVKIDTKIIKKSIEETSDSLPTVKFYPASISEIQILSVKDLVVYIKSLHTERELLAEITLIIDNEEIESRDLKLLPGVVLPVIYKLKDEMLSKHTIKVVLDFKKPKDLRNWEEFVMFNRREETISFNFEDMIKIPYADFEIKIDGDVSDWEGKVRHIFLGERKDVYPLSQREKWQEDSSGKIYLAWDKDYFYIGAVVEDDKHLCTKSRRAAFEGDFLKCEFTPYLIGRKIAPRIFELALLKDVVDMDIYNIRKGLSLKHLFKKCEYSLKRDEVKKETTYEIKVPFMDSYPLYIKGQEGNIVDFNIKVFDNNKKGDKYWLQLIPEVSPDPQYDVSPKCVLWK